MARSRIGIWLIGAKGGVASTACVGLAALKKDLVGTAGLVSELPLFAGIDFAAWKDFVVGGHDIREVSMFDAAMQMHSQSHAIDRDLILACKSELDQIDKNVRPGTLHNVGPTISRFAEDSVRRRRESPRAIIERVQQDLAQFISRHKLDHAIVVNVASTEPTIDAAALPDRWADLSKLLDRPRKCPLAASSLYAIAALDMGQAYINFTPSLGSAPAAICELAQLRATQHMGHDGKTGETLLKSTLAPMFAKRNLEVMSWVGHNIFGNMDGKVLDDPANKQSKVTSKDRLLRQIFGYSPQTLVSIEYIESLADWKTAWDHIHFKGFLGTPMTFQFIWQGCDSILAAPLVLDLVRFTELARRRGEIGLLSFLASFFKSPLGVTEHDFARQFEMLRSWIDSDSAIARAK